MEIIIKTVLKEVMYKGHRIVRFEDDYMQEFAIIDGNKEQLYASIADAKRAIRGEQTKYRIE